MIGSFSHHKLGNLKIKSALVFAIPSILSLLLVRKIAASQNFDVTNHDRVSIDCNLRFHDCKSKIKEAI
jgi:hypothetical protein